MEIIKHEEADIFGIVAALKQGKTIVYPTETCYGLGGDATNQVVVEKIFQIKQRQKDKAMLVIVPSVAMMMSYINWNETLENISRKYWPGALTVVVRAKDNCTLAPGVLSTDRTVAFRVTSHHLASELSQVLGLPLISTSANLTSTANQYDAQSIVKMFQEQDLRPDIIIDAGELPHRSPSTVVRVKAHGLEILRQGEVVVV